MRFHSCMGYLAAILLWALENFNSIVSETILMPHWFSFCRLVCSVLTWYLFFSCGRPCWLVTPKSFQLILLCCLILQQLHSQMLFPSPSCKDGWQPGPVLEEWGIYECLRGERGNLRETSAFLIKREDVTSVNISLASYLTISVMVTAAVAVMLSGAKGQEDHKDRGSDIAESWNQSQ